MPAEPSAPPPAQGLAIPTSTPPPLPRTPAAAEELADVLLYLLRLADQCHIDLAAAAHDKLRKNAAKYPAEQCRGSSAKYTRYATAAAATAAARGDHSAGSAGGGGGGEGGAAGGKR